jgi:hypothetical protein
VFAVLLAISLLMLLARGLRTRNAGRTHIGLAAILPAMRRSYLPALRHTAFLLFLLGMPFFAVALADPHTSFTREEVSYPGRRIAILLDGSSSMTTKFETKTLRPQDPRAYYTNIAAAERFMKLRMTGPYHDLVALIELGNQAYVVTPFTTDYENVLLSIRLVGDPELGPVRRSGTTILRESTRAPNCSSLRLPGGFRQFDGDLYRRARRRDHARGQADGPDHGRRAQIQNSALHDSDRVQHEAWRRQGGQDLETGGREYRWPFLSCGQ